ncbi:MAG: hypothetical protein HY753_00410 [Nitrospirae bacterium]|nr:hypothetical protein [Nitrospirota bacterium]
MSRSLLVKLFLALFIGLFLGFTIWFQSYRKEPSPVESTRVDSTSIEQKTSASPLNIKGLSYSTYAGNKLIARIEADEFKVRQRKFWVFNIKPFNEATLTNVRLKVYFYKDTPSKTKDVDMLSFSKDILTLDKEGKATSKEIGLITRGVINGFVLEIYKADKASILIKAQKAYIDFRRKGIKMMDVSMEGASSGKFIQSKTVMWNNKEKVFEIPGEYISRTQHGITNGKRIKVDLDFNAAPL